MRPSPFQEETIHHSHQLLEGDAPGPLSEWDGQESISNATQVNSNDLSVSYAVEKLNKF